MSEASIAKKIGATLVSNSGRGYYKGDMRLDKGGKKFLIDAKEHKSFNLNKAVWRKTCTDAFSWGWDYTPMILAELDDGTLVACIAYDDLVEILEENNG